MLIDAFIFFNELDMLEFRMRLLFDQVDKFVIVEADTSFAGAARELVYPQHAARFAWAAGKIVYLPLKVEVSAHEPEASVAAANPDVRAARIEAFQRDALLAACAHFSDDATLVMSDVDEIPSREVLAAVLCNGEFAASLAVQPVACRQQMFYYNLRTLRDDLWHGSILCSLGLARSIGTQALRDRRSQLPGADPGGWHLSYFNDVAGIALKIRSFAHQRLNVPRIVNGRHIADCIANGSDLFGRDLANAPLSAAFFPDYFVAEARRFPAFRAP